MAEPREGRTIWDFWAPRYEGLLAQRFSLGPSRRLVHARLEAAAPAATRVLDLGCGVGQFARELVERRAEATVLAVDAAPAMIARAEQDYAHPRITYRLGSVGDVTAADGPFDAVTCMHAFPYFPDPEATLAAVHRLLRPGGRVMLVMGNIDGPCDWLWLKVIGLTTTKASYPSTRRLTELLAGAGFNPDGVRSIEKWPIFPSVNLVEGLK
ncbi:MAG: class I SAM-dependent methyltransferase [Spirochaetia bacterium]|jgi:2-polyprenyl-3-methyl-5-hydroxy-6-metoxy-1,4-benzoquinol methylase